MSEETHDFTVDYRKGAMVASFFSILTFTVIVGLFAWLYPHSTHKTGKGYFALALCPVVLFCCLALLYGALRIMILKSPALTVNQRGIVHVSSVGDTIHIPWSKIAGFETREVPGQYGSRSMWLDVLPNGPSLKPILSIHADQLAERPAQILHDLKQYRAHHALTTSDAPAEEKQAPRFTYRAGFAVGLIFFLLLGIAMTLFPVLQSFGNEPTMSAP